MNKRLFCIVLIFGILVFSGCNTPADEQSMISDSASNTITVSSTTDTTDTTSTTVTTTSITSATTMKTTTTKRTTTTTSRKQTTTSKTTRGTSGTITEPLDKISDETFIELVQNDNNAIYQSLYIIEGKEYGRVISSSDSKEDAVNVCTRHFTDTRMPQYINTVKKCTVIYESAILYGLHVAWETRGQVYEENVISFKSSVADITARNVVYGDEESFRIHTTAQEDIQTIVLYLSHDTYLGQTMLDYDMQTYENEYVMTVYSYEICMGDWGLKDEYTLLKHTIIVHKTTGIVDCQEPRTIKTVYVDGALTNIGEVVVDY